MKKERGSILIFAILMVALMFAGALALAKVFLPKIKSVNQAVYSAVAIFRADAAAELCLYEARKQINPNPRPSSIVDGSVVYTIASLSASEVMVTNDCRVMGNNIFNFRANGRYRGFNRSLEISQ